MREVYEEHSLVELELKTGRTHQIRVHLSHLGYPIVGDDMYGGREVEGIISRQALHAALLVFTHPITNQRAEFQAPLHEDMATLARALRANRFIASPNVAGATIDLEKMLS